MLLANQAQDRAVNDIRFTKVEKELEEHAEQIAGLRRDRSWVLGGAAAISALGITLGRLFGFHP